jgi:hypothetical protein
MRNPSRTDFHALLVAGLLTFAGIAGAAPKKAPKPPGKPAAPMTFTPAAMDLLPGETYPVTLFVPSPNGTYYSGELSFAHERGLRVEPDARFPDRIPPWGVKVFPKVRSAPDAEGTGKVVAILTPAGRTATVNVALVRPEVKLVPGIHQLRIQVTNPMRSRPLKGRIGVANPDRFLGNVTSGLLDIAPGSTQEIKIPLPGAAPATDETYAFTYNLQTWAGYRDEKTVNLQFPPQPPAADVRGPG